LTSIASALAERFLKEEGLPAEPKVLFYNENKETYRATLRVPMSENASINSRIREKYEVMKESSMFVIFGFPYEFLNPKSAELVKLCRQKVEKDFPSLDNNGNLKIQLDVKSKLEEDKLFVLLQSKGFSVSRKTTLHKNKKPGLCVKFQIAKWKHETTPKTAQMAQGMQKALDSFVVEWLSTKSWQERVAMLTGLFSEGQDEGSLATLKTLLPPGIGLFDKNSPFKTEEGSIKVNEL